MNKVKVLVVLILVLVAFSAPALVNGYDEDYGGYDEDYGGYDEDYGGYDEDYGGYDEDYGGYDEDYDWYDEGNGYDQDYDWYDEGNGYDQDYDWYDEGNGYDQDYDWWEPLPAALPPTPPKPPPPTKKPGFFDDCGKNLWIGGVGCAGVNFVCGAGQATGLAAAGVSGLVGAVAGSFATFTWNIAEKIFDPPGTTEYLLTGGEALAALAILIALFTAIPVLVVFRRRITAVLTAVLYGMGIALMVYLPVTPVNYPFLFNALPFVLFVIVGLVSWCASIKLQSPTGWILQLSVVVFLVSIGYGLMATIASFASGWGVLRNYSTLVGILFLLSVIIVEQAIAPGPRLRSKISKG